MQFITKKTIYILLTLITFSIGYLVLRYAFTSPKTTALGSEIILITFGSIVTMLITASLLNKQSEIELDKEQRVKIFEIKSNLYFELIDFIEQIILKNDIDDKDIVTLDFLTHKVSILANVEVLKEYQKFVTIFKEIAKDNALTKIESKELTMQLSKLCSKIRYDMIANNDNKKETSILIRSLTKNKQ